MSSIAEEIWKDIPNYNGVYQVSNLGNVKSLNYGRENILKPRPINKYLSVNLYKNGKQKSITIHKLVALCFLNHTSKRYEGLIVDHIDNNKINNKLDNLCLTTQRINSNKDKKNKSSKFAGVSWHKSSKRWQSRIYYNGKIHYLGVFISEEEAGEKYKDFLNQIKQL